MALLRVILFLAIRQRAHSGCTGVSPCFPLIHYLNDQILKQTCAICHYTYLCKLAHLWVPWWPRYWDCNTHFPRCPNSYAILFCNCVPRLNNAPNDLPFFQNIHHIVPNEPTKQITTSLSEYHASVVKHVCCPPMCRFMIHRCATAFPIKCLTISVNPLALQHI